MARPFGAPSIGFPSNLTAKTRLPRAVGLRFERATKLPDGRKITSVVGMAFPRAKSWVRIIWGVNDPQKEIEGVGAESRLNLSDTPVLVDVGARNYVYMTLHKDEAAALRAGRLDEAKSDRPAWETLLGAAGTPRPYVVATPEGWGRAEAGRVSGIDSAELPSPWKASPRRDRKRN